MTWLALFWYIITLVSCQTCQDDSHSCDRYHEPVMPWQADAELEAFNAKDMGSWLRSQVQNMVRFCPSESELAMTMDPDLALRIIKDPKDCQGSHSTDWNGKWDKEGLPKGSGILKKAKTRIDEEKRSNMISSDDLDSRPCLDLQDSIQQYSGPFKQGLPHGRGTITYEYDLSSLSGPFVKGAIHGVGKLSHKKGNLLFAGLYQNGKPNGPGWVFPPDWQRSGFVQAHFKAGVIQDYPIFWASPDLNQVFVGTLNGTRLQKARQTTKLKMGEYNCVRYLDHDMEEEETKIEEDMKLPVIIKVDAELGAVLVRTSKTVIFNRIAKTGSQSITELLVQLEKETGIKPNIVIKGTEYLLEPPDMVASVVEMVDSDPMPMAYVRHYNFVNFYQFGAFYSPTYINMVRHPVERIISWFYYWRAAWNIVERKLQFPNEPLPDPDFLRKDFDSCVLTGDPECQYIEGSNVLQYPDHRSQMMAFCGHEPFCAEFNSQAVLNRAKENVDKYYSVVGVLESLNKTLAVLENELPDIFDGALAKYHDHAEIKRKQIRNAYKLPVSSKVWDLVAKNFTREIEFYEFVKQRLDQQFDRMHQDQN